MNQEYVTVTLHVNEVKVLFDVLVERPYREVAGTIDRLRRELIEQSRVEDASAGHDDNGQTT